MAAIFLLCLSEDTGIIAKAIALSPLHLIRRSPPNYPPHYPYPSEYQGLGDRFPP
ncbi:MULTISPECIES: hypothetical protein [unclassified Roseofilum]|uniref:hypothetical protein n=1 Tax=unclassified Roseofilum TaxID=2620099 RepID=UPI00298DE57D|nr:MULTISPECIES: hypothetical protein [unclassified Roseofilum]